VRILQRSRGLRTRLFSCHDILPEGFLGADDDSIVVALAADGNSFRMEIGILTEAAGV
jgi:hypothetical protein